ncbi:unnamed protein product [Adineta steineri]|uniref:Transmembrane protein n=1 Tax=Adineta steineri TaxID=433720 RepID=A0A814YFW6_9BILA|nr:unnamed protein product [Adineta steineri]CAF1230053.1 unnamed protein product [Adineta steineri]CAF1302010.1 unnamed protein product [Adineta steineri]
MLCHIIFSLLFFCIPVFATKIPFINNTVFIPTSNTDITIITNQTCSQCLCFILNSSYIALNCLPNDTCQFFNTFSRTYTIQTISQARLYFFQEIFPNASQCCISNTDYLINKLNTTTPIHANIPGPRCLVFDNNGYLVTVSWSINQIIRLYPTNLTIVSYPLSPRFNDSPQLITYHNEAYYVAFPYYIVAVDTNTLTILSNITAPNLSGTRGMMFLNNGQTLIVASTFNSYLLFFNQSATDSTSYSFVNQQKVNYIDPHGFWYVSDTYFYVTSWQDNTIYAYSATNNSVIWTEQLFVDAHSVAPSSDGNHLTVDECDRYWFMLGGNGIRIFNNQASLIANLTRISASPFYSIITDKYVIYVSDTSSNLIIRIDPNIQCYSDEEN